MSVATIKALIKTRLDSISEVGKVNDYRRWTIDWDKVAEYFKEGDKINGWIIEWSSAAGMKEASGSLMITRDHTFRIWGLYSLKDSTASAKTFENIVESVMNEMDKDQDWSGEVRWDEPSRLVAISENVFAGVLCHRCEIILRLREFKGFS